MAKTAWPTTTELTDYLAGLGVTSIPTGVVLQDKLDEAVSAMHEILGYSPFLEGSSASYDYNPPRSRHLDLGQPFTTITTVKVSKSSGNAGTALTDQVDFWPKPFGGPYTHIQFRDAQYGEPESIEVTGKQGVTATAIPIDLWTAVMNYAAAQVYRVAMIAGTVGGQVSRVKQGMREVEYAGGSASADASTDNKLKNDAEKVFRKYRPIRCAGLH